MKKRLFLAIQLPKNILDAFAVYKKEYNANGIRWTAPENLHITVYFLGYIDERDLPVIRERIKNTLGKFQPFELEFNRIEFAPPNRPARMIWAVFTENIALPRPKGGGGQYKLLIDRAYEALKEFSYRDYRGKEAIAHVTLARLHDPSVARSLNLRQPNIDERVFQVLSCDLMESQLLREGPAYTVAQTFLFAKV